MRKAIHSKRIVTPYGIKEGYLLIEDSKIIGTTKSMPEVLNQGNWLILP